MAKTAAPTKISQSFIEKVVHISDSVLCMCVMAPFVLLSSTMGHQMQSRGNSTGLYTEHFHRPK